MKGNQGQIKLNILKIFAGSLKLLKENSRDYLKFFLCCFALNESYILLNYFLKPQSKTHALLYGVISLAAFLIVVYYSFRLEISAYFYTFERLKGASSGFKISYIKSKEFIGCYTRTMVLLAIITAVPCIVAGMIVISAQGQSKWIAVAVIALIAGYLLCMLALAPIVSIAEPSESHCIKRSRTITEGNLLSILLIYGLWIIILYGPGILMFGRQYPAAKDVASILESMFNTAINIVMTAVLPMLYNQIMAVRKENKNMLKKAAL